ncbi:hypothetical protein A2954_04325 [Candidatus Roizmanbacteria bacterium RIFCSPLOWO2_01_FULL_37_12]|uniref:NAD-dependent epimerase/dehydratase domain-containing protein n=1 Tax=Candidatus Roizmanbacteria bacterium RIFCSPLOWO2_01_FULL_37_12 TaxID=1802056 RepID=A0A1F7IFV0_9BACT|nr:MAG: hypothetical protein A3D76_06235 [Candidatus Roizmanbacteria bacterium RIFCSPHIGHO2_02_FULL_37_9b]OGK42210.1 MAG: hypothetical protein A2954_04325 [Candidatus Roizmanbacteria bacterium RIFCSPLOWO2_01_FULL_37_12]
MNILITGGVGFIGTNTVLHFAKNKKNRIYIVDDFSRSGVEKNAIYLKKTYPQIKIIKSHIRNINQYKIYLKKADAIIHLAGQTAVTTSIQKPDEDFDTNLLGSFALLEAIRNYNPRSIILYSSTNKVYGDLNSHRFKKNKKLKIYEELCHSEGINESEKLDFISPYGCSKGATDLYFLDYARIFGLKTVVFRQSCIYGEFQIGVEDQGWVAHFSNQFIRKKPLTIFGDGMQVRDLLYIQDLIKLYELTINNISKTKGQAFNIGGGINNAYSLLQVIDLIKKITGTNIKTSFKSERLGDQKYFVSANKKVNKILGWKPTTDFKDGLRKLINWQYNHVKRG